VENKKRKIAIMQPTYIPWSGYFALIESVEVFVFLDDVQFSKQSWQQRNRIKSSQGELTLTVPVSLKQSNSKCIKDVVIAPENKWRKTHLKSISNNYHKSEYFKVFYPVLEEVLNQEFTTLANLNIHIIREICDFLDISTDFVRSSEMNSSDGRVERLIDIISQLNGDTYISPPGSFDYLNENNLFQNSQIELLYLNYKHPVYKQQYGEFISHLSVIDVLLNEGKSAIDILKGGIERPLTNDEMKELQNVR
jgi:hypothetical protein